MMLNDNVLTEESAGVRKKEEENWWRQCKSGKQNGRVGHRINVNPNL